MSNKLKNIKKAKAKKEPYVLAIVDGSNMFSKEGCKFVPKSEAIEKGYPYAEGDTPYELWENMIKKCYGNK